MSAYESTGQETTGTIGVQPHSCDDCGTLYEGDRTPRGRPYCGECGLILAGERPTGGGRYEGLEYSALGVGR